MVSWMSKDEEMPLKYFMDVDGISRQAFMIYIDPYEEGMHNDCMVLRLKLWYL